MSASIPVAFAQNVLADQYDEQVKKLQSEADSYQQQAATLGALASTLQAQLDVLTKQKNEIQAQINTSQAKRDKLEKDIAATEKKIEINKEALGEIVADMYVDSSISPLEMLASSKNIGDYVDKQEYRSSMQDNLSTKIKECRFRYKYLPSKLFASRYEFVAESRIGRDTARNGYIGYIQFFRG